MKTLSALRSLCVSIGFSFVHIGAFISFYILHTKGELNETVIFATNLMMSYLQDYNYCVAYGCDTLFEINVIFKRFINIMKIKDLRMIYQGNSTDEAQELQKVEEGKNNSNT